MRFRLMAAYRGAPYEVGVGPTSSDVVLFAALPPPEELGFEPAPGYWRKRVTRAEIDVLWESRPIGTFRGEPCLVLDDQDDRLHIVYLGNDGRRARELGYWQVDRGVFELLTPRDEVTGLTEEKVEKAPPWAEPTAPPPAERSYPYGAQPWPSPAGDGGGPGTGPSYLREPTLAPAGVWNGYGAPNGAAGRGGYGPPNGTGEWNSNSAPYGTGERNGYSLPPGAGEPNGYGLPNGTGERNGYGLPSGTGERPAYAPNGAGYASPAGPGGWNGSGAPYSSGGWSSTGGSPLAAPPASAPPRRRQVPPAGGRAARKQRVQTRSIFSELADLAAIPRSAYALEHEADGAMCLLRTEDGFEVFSAADGARHEVRSFADDEAAYFYLFGVLAAEAVRNGSLAPPR